MTSDWRHTLPTILRYGWVALTIIVSVLLVISSFGGAVDPARWAFPAIIAMAFPILFIANIVCGVVNIFTARWFATVQGVALLLSIKAFLIYCPLHFSTPEVAPADSSRIIKVMTYNVGSCIDQQDTYPDGTNRTVSQILHSDADFVCLQETGLISKSWDSRVPPSQHDSLRRIYPYRAYVDFELVSILSRHPIRELYIPQVKVSQYAAWQGVETVIDGDTLLIMSVHLQSLGLSDEDKAAYHNMTDGRLRHNIGDARSIYRKIADADIARAEQARVMARQIDSLGYHNVILAGDFNDIGGCYAIRTIEKIGFRSTHSEIGLGPIITFNANRFYFCIDHILYRGSVKPLTFTKGGIKSSDHYPLTATFLLERPDSR